MYKSIWNKHAAGSLMLVEITDNGISPIGTAFLCHRKGYFITSAHNVDLMKKFSLVVPEDIHEFTPMTLEHSTVIDVEVRQLDPINDVALIKIKEHHEIHVPSNIFKLPENVKVGSSIACLGYPFATFGQHSLKITSGIISSKVLSSKNSTKQFQIDAMIHDCNSGGPLLELESGAIIGVITERFSPAANKGGLMIGNYSIGTESSIGLAVTIDYAINLMKEEGIYNE